MSETPTSYTPPPPPPPPPPGGSYTPPPPPPPPGGTAPNSDRTIMLVLSYLGILCLIPLLVKKDDPDVQWHAKNGTALFGAEVAWVIVVIIVTLLRIPLLGCGMTMISCVVWIGFLVISIIAIMKAMKGERLRLPVLTDFAEKM
ncbi:MAG TPA: DUF4870 domain-containing protein [Thermoanaerobaculia bacterium]